MRIAIVGSRGYPDLDEVRAFVRSLPSGTVVVSGGAHGVDAVAENEARKCGLTVDIYLADWKNRGGAAGFLRNHTIVENADEVVAFWDGVSRGTSHTIAIARRKGKPVTIHQPPVNPSS
jgi:hypothetical protein